MAKDSCFSCTNKVMFWSGVVYLIYQICDTIFTSGGPPLFMEILVFAFAGILVISSAFSSTMSRSSEGLVCYIICTGFLLIFVIVLVLVALLKGYVDNLWSIIMFICWCILGFCILCALVIAINMRKSNPGYK